jgi:type II secretory pathway pseudopilin PulG
VTPRARRRVARALSRAYTAVEVLISISLLAIGASAVIAMQRGAIQSNLDARKLDVANSIAREWIERLRRDAANWTLPSTLNTYANAKLLSTYLPAGNTAAIATWSYPDAYLATATVPDGVSPGFDILGRDLLPTDIAGSNTKPSSAIFCVNIRLNWLVVNQLIRAEVRVFWQRDLYNNPNMLPTVDWCNSTNAATVTGDTNRYHFVYAASAVRFTPVQ